MIKFTSLTLAMSLALTGWASAQANDKNYVIRFKEAAMTPVKPGSVRDERIGADPVGWAYVGERVVGHIQALERKHRVKANTAFGQVFKGMSARLTPAQLEALRRDPSVDLIEEEQIYSVDARPKPGGGGTTTSTQSIPWGISKTGATQSYTLAGNGSGVVTGVRTYVIDTGVDMKNADLNRPLHVNFIADRKNTDCNGHGTHVAGTMAAYDNTAAVVGIAPGAPVYGVKVLDCNGSGTTTSVIKGVDWVAANALLPAVANMSLGGGASQLLDDAVRAAAARGIVFAIAAGNSSASACTASPARIGGVGTPGVLVTAANDVNDLEASFSNYGSCVDIWAPGVAVPSLKLGGGVVSLSGTSMASPHVAGAAALYWARNPSATHGTVSSYLRQMSQPTGTTSKDGRAIYRLMANIP
jgi:subtilisin family serine protease